MEQSAVEFLIEIFVLKKGFLSLQDFEQAKEMEKEQIKDAFIFSKDPFGVSIGNSHTIKKAEDYYNTTFKSE